MRPEYARIDLRGKRGWMHPQESGWKMEQVPGDVITYPILLDPVLVWSQENYLSLLLITVYRKKSFPSKESELRSYRAVVLNRGASRDSQGARALHALQHRKILNRNVSLPNVAPVLILRSYIISCLVPAEVEVGVKFLEILLAEFELACKHPGSRLGELFIVGMPSPFDNNICAVLEFENSMVHIEFKVASCITERLA